MYQQLERLKFLLSRSLSSCNTSGSSNQSIKIDNLPEVMGEGASINVNQVSVIVNQLKVDLNECNKIAKNLEQYAPNDKKLPLSQVLINFRKNMILKSLEKKRLASKQNVKRIRN